MLLSVQSHITKHASNYHMLTLYEAIYLYFAYVRTWINYVGTPELALHTRSAIWQPDSEARVCCCKRLLLN